ncbi:hypothetical protein [Corynebacterium heidelbergense]|nr:hypothetical protein [Corynebacterium heidelbergense]
MSRDVSWASKALQSHVSAMIAQDSSSAASLSRLQCEAGDVVVNGECTSVMDLRNPFQITNLAYAPVVPVVEASTPLDALLVMFSGSDAAPLAAAARWDQAAESITAAMDHLGRVSGDVAAAAEGISFDAARQALADITSSGRILAANASIMAANARVFPEVRATNLAALEAIKVSLAGITEPAEKVAAEQAAVVTFVSTQLGPSLDLLTPPVVNLGVPVLGHTGGGAFDTSGPATNSGQVVITSPTSAQGVAAAQSGATQVAQPVNPAPATANQAPVAPAAGGIQPVSTPVGGTPQPTAGAGVAPATPAGAGIGPVGTAPALANSGLNAQNAGGAGSGVHTPGTPAAGTYGAIGGTGTGANNPGTGRGLTGNPVGAGPSVGTGAGIGAGTGRGYTGNSVTPGPGRPGRVTQPLLPKAVVDADARAKAGVGGQAIGGHTTGGRAGAAAGGGKSRGGMFGGLHGALGGAAGAKNTGRSRRSNKASTGGFVGANEYGVEEYYRREYLGQKPRTVRPVIR